MSLLYLNEKILKYEEKLEFNNIIVELEKLYKEEKDERILITIFTYSWFFLVDGDINQSPIDYDWKFLKISWLSYLTYGLNMDLNSIEFNFMAGYTLYQSWIYLGEDFKNKANELLNKCILIDEFHLLSKIAYSILNNESFIIDNDLILKLFPNNSILDNYFKEIFKQKL